MSDIKYVNEHLDINIGDVFYHKSDNRRLVVIGFFRAKNHASREVLDKNTSECRFFDNDKVKYNSQMFLYAELSKTPLEY